MSKRLSDWNGHSTHFELLRDHKNMSFFEPYFRLAVELQSQILYWIGKLHIDVGVSTDKDGYENKIMILSTLVYWINHRSCQPSRHYTSMLASSRVGIFCANSTFHTTSVD